MTPERLAELTTRRDELLKQRFALGEELARIDAELWKHGAKGRRAAWERALQSKPIDNTPSPALPRGDRE